MYQISSSGIRCPSLPAAAPSLRNYDIDGMNLPARQMSGDYYGYIRIAPDRWGVAIADVSGKGVPASLIMAMCRSVLRGQAVGNLFVVDPGGGVLGGRAGDRHRGGPLLGTAAYQTGEDQTQRQNERRSHGDSLG